MRNINSNISNDNLICHKKQNGIFFTFDEDLIEKIISIVDIENIQDKKVLEPSCGDGKLIISLIKKIHKIHNAKPVIDYFLKNNLFFNDIDNKILSSCIINIKNYYYQLFNQELNYSLNSFNCDFSLKSETIFNIPKMDFIIGNPPYITLYGRRDKKKTEQQRNYFLNNYKQFPSFVKNGKLNYVMFFIENSLDLLLPNGELNFIIDASFNETAYKYTREYIIKNYFVKNVIHNISGFDGVSSGQLILHISKNNNLKELTKVQNYKTKEIYSKNYINFYDKNNDYKLNFYKDCNITTNILNKVNVKSDTFSNIYGKKSLRTCTMLLNMENKFIKDVDNNCKLRENEYWYYKGSKSLKNKFFKLISNKVFNYNKNLQNEINDKLKIQLKNQGIKNKKRLGLGDSTIFINPKVFIRQSAKQIICSFDNNNSTANNSLYVISLYGNSEENIKELLFLCGYLNSSLITFIAQKLSIIRYFEGKQPQIKVSDLHKLPIITNNFIKEQIYNIVKRIYKNNDNNYKYIQEIDKILYEYFDVNENEEEFMLSEINQF